MQNLVDLIVKIILFIFNKPDEIQKAQINVWNKLSNMYGSIVQYGPFKGMKIGKKKSWELEYGLTTKILGTYEEQILNILINFQKKIIHLLILQPQMDFLLLEWLLKIFSRNELVRD